MSIATRRKFGISLVAISIAAFLILLAVGLVRGQWRFDGSGTTASGNGAYAAYSVDLGVSEFYFIPIFLFGVAGAVCLLWPSRKPPKLKQ